MFNKGNILVTGGAGFIGSALCRKIVKNTNTDLIILDKLTYASNLSSIESLITKKNVFFYKESIGNIKFLNQIFQKHKPKLIFNLAAETHVDNSILKPSNFIKTNILDTHNFLYAILQYFKKLQKNEAIFLKLLHISTDEVYGDIDLNQPGVDEKTAYKPSSPYSASKASADHLIKAYHRTYGLPGLISNCSNNYGPFQHSEKLIPVVINNILNNKKIPVYGNGSQIREWIYVDDHCDALLKLMESGCPGDNYNIGSGNEITNLDLIRNIYESLKEKSLINNIDFNSIINFTNDRPGHDKRYAVDSSKIKKLCNWKPLVSLQKGLNKTIDYYIHNKKIDKKLGVVDE